MIFKLQKCISMGSYIQQLFEITKQYGLLVAGGENISSLTSGTIMLYLMSIHPRQYVVVGNLNISDDETEMLNFIWGNNEYQPKPLFGIRTTNGTEGENNALLRNDFRYQTVCQAMITFIAWCSQIRGKWIQCVTNYWRQKLQFVRNPTLLLKLNVNTLVNILF
jgi:hypothetical protein